LIETQASLRDFQLKGRTFVSGIAKPDAVENPAASVHFLFPVSLPLTLG